MNTSDRQVTIDTYVAQINDFGQTIGLLRKEVERLESARDATLRAWYELDNHEHEPSYKYQNRASGKHATLPKGRKVRESRSTNVIELARARFEKKQAAKLARAAHGNAAIADVLRDFLAP